MGHMVVHKFDIIWPNISTCVHYISSVHAERVITIISDLRRELPERFIRIIDEFGEQLTEFFYVLNSETGLEINVISELSERLGRLYSRTDEIRVYLSSRRISDGRIDDIIVGFLKLANKYIKSSNNACSIVFKKDNDVLFLGDVESRIIKKLSLDGILQPCYRIIKIPHHGTKSHYTPHIPCAQNYLIPFGKHRNYSICEQYVNGKSSFVYVANCSMDRIACCEYYRRFGTCSYRCKCVPNNITL
jgi:hypothetical protein